MSQIESISCDNCGNVIPLEHVLAKKLQKDFDAKIEAERTKIAAIYQNKEIELNNERKKLEEYKAKEKEIFNERLKKERTLLTDQLRKSIQDDYQIRMDMQSKEIEEKQEELKKLRQKEIEMEQLKRKMEDQEKEIELKYIKMYNDRSKEIEEQISKRISEQSAMTIYEKDKQLSDLKKQIEEMKRKAEQGSMQLQGEVQELAIEEYLQSNFPLDEITEIKKGARGGDCIQIIHTRTGRNIGSIYYESKRTKDFSQGWIEKFKKDMQEKTADIGVLVTSAMPKEMDRMGMKDGIWVCTFEEFKALCFILRESLVRIHQVRSAEENKGDKMHLLYDFLTGNEFRMQIEGIVDGFSQMQQDLNKEKSAMMRIWAQREKQIIKVLENTSNLYGSIKGIAGSAIKQIDQLELPDGDIGLLDE